MPTVIVMVENIVVGTFLKDTLIHPLIGTGQFIYKGNFSSTSILVFYFSVGFQELSHLHMAYL